MTTLSQVLACCGVLVLCAVLMWVIWQTAPLFRKALSSNIGNPGRGRRGKKVRTASPLKRTNERVHAPKVSTSTRYRS
jgi:hypothetical protein